MLTTRKKSRRAGFTLVELLVVIAVIGILTSMTLFAMFGAREDAKHARTQAMVAKIHELVMLRYESYRTRAIPLRIPIPAGTAPQQVALARLQGMRQLMRMELPDRITDLTDPPIPIPVSTASGVVAIELTEPALWNTYRRQIKATWTAQNQGAECLYMILAAMRENDTNGLDFFTESEIGDADGDLMLEIQDPWGKPIEFLRWPAGFRAYPGPDGQWGQVAIDDNSNGFIDDSGEADWPRTDDVASPSDLQAVDSILSPDQLDLLRVDYRWHDADLTNDPFNLYPLIFSSGPDKIYDIATDTVIAGSRFRYVTTTPLPNDPYFVLTFAAPVLTIWSTGPADVSNMLQLGTPIDANGDGELGHRDNITNHYIEVKSP